MLTGCEEVIDVELENEPIRLSIDASLSFYTLNGGVDTDTRIYLTESAEFFDQNIPIASGANIFITNLSNGDVITYGEFGNSGIYDVANPPFFPEFNIDYELTVFYQGQTYKSVTQFVPTVSIDNVERGENTLFGGDEIETIVSFTDEGTREDFYLFDFDFGEFFTSDDQFYQGSSYSFSFFYDEIDTGKTAEIEIWGVDQSYYRYMDLLLEQTGDGRPGLFASTPARVRGNITNPSDPDRFAYGYFNMSQADRASFVLTENP